MRQRIDAAIAFRAVAGDRRDRLPARPRRSRPAAVADRRSLRRLPGRAGAVAGDGPAAAGGGRRARGRCSQPRGILARNDPRARLLEGLEQRVEVLARRGARTVDGPRRPASSTTSICGAGRRPACSSTSARTGRRRRATRAAGCSTASATTAASRCALGAAVPTRRSRSTSPRMRWRAIARERGAERRRRRRAGRQRVRRAARARAARRAVRHHRARPAGVRQEQGGGRRRRPPATRRSTCGR